ncbi:BolA family protein [Melaminivora alkalimesophila]|uniref:BolA protein family transcriptional regulator n=1 Tax=Melaminivora alkalimesophila TaxID=1165852 RepID=A0A317RDH7_9BURK|nr:BolA family protein [Melaminivora alkalimesophila]PWW44593.1 BolA protein family transcriptional regulator [Melaminivora alkalimesophila]
MTASTPGADGDAITAEAMQAHLREALKPTFLEVLDESWQHEGHAGANGTGFGTHFRVRVASPLFEGQRRVAQHRLVYDALQVFIDRGAHAIAIETL